MANPFDFYAPLDLHKNELRNAVIQVLASAPGSPTLAQIYFDSGVDTHMGYGSGGWYPFDARKATNIPNTALATNPLNRANHTGTQTASTISDFDTQVRTSRLDQMATPTSNVNMGSQKIVSLADPTSSQDAATMNYVDSQIAAGATPTGSAGGHLTGTYPNPSIASAVIVDSMISSSAAINVAKLANATAANILLANAGGVWTPTAMSGNVTINSSGATTIGAGVIVDSMISGSAAIALSKLATNPLARANHTGTQTASTISDFDTQVRTSRLDQMAAPTASVSFNSQAITNLLDPTNPQDGATKNYVDTQIAAVSAGLDFKSSARVIATTNGTLASAYQNGSTVDGITLVTGDRIVLAGQTAPAENGIFLVNASGSPTRATDANQAGEIGKGALIYIEEGTDHNNELWICTATTSDPWIPGTDGSTWTQFLGLADLSATAPLLKTGNVLSLDYGYGLDVVGGQLVVDTAVISGKYAETIGDGTNTSFTITHNLGTRDVTVQVRRNASPYNYVFVDTEAATTNTVELDFSSYVPTSNEFRVIIKS